MSSCKVYYKAFREDATPILRQINVDCNDYEIARGMVLAQLHKDCEIFYRPVLVLLQGGKK